MPPERAQCYSLSPLPPLSSLQVRATHTPPSLYSLPPLPTSVASSLTSLPPSPPSLQVRAYYTELERHLGEAHRQAARLVRHQAELGEAVHEFGLAMSALGRFEESVSARAV